MTKRITFELSDEKHKEIRIKALNKGKSVKQVAEELFEKWLKK